MSYDSGASCSLADIELQPESTRELPESERAALIVKAIQVDGNWVIQSRYGDDCWQLDGLPNNAPEYRRQVNFLRVPAIYRATMKAVMYRYLRRGQEGQPRPKGNTSSGFFSAAMPFLRYLSQLKIPSFRDVPYVVFANYAAECREVRKKNGKQLSKFSLNSRFLAVQALYELSQYTHDPFPTHPWQGNSPKAMVKLTRAGMNLQDNKTPLMPDTVFCKLFEKAFEIVQGGEALLDLRDSIAKTQTEPNCAPHVISYAKKRHLAALGWDDSLAAFNHALIDLRTACYIILASTSGCRNHELGNVQEGSHHRTEDNEGILFHWMRSKSEKIDSGIRDWMIPEASVRALHLMYRWAAPFQAMIAEEIAERREINPRDPEIAEAQQHRHSLFLGLDAHKGKIVRTLSGTAWNRNLRIFADNAGLNWSPNSHQFRRKFANYVAHSRFGDLRYLREHFAHWSMDMTLHYAMDDEWGSHLDLELYDEIQAEYENIKLDTVNGWFIDDSLSGRYGLSIKQWQREPRNLAMFKNHKIMVASIARSTSIRSNGHAWCTADNDGCVGNTVERTRCSNCNHAVISSSHLHVYREQYNNLKNMHSLSDIGEAGQIRVLRDLERCRGVLMQLGFDPEDDTK
ncbi:integrase [Pseudomonas mandelii]|uniref:integrase n=1 Tax=Pseudomonas mandelii TaxID=75612 RepID=UPI00398D0CA7